MVLWAILTNTRLPCKRTARSCVGTRSPRIPRWSLQKGYVRPLPSCATCVVDKANRSIPHPKLVTPESTITNIELYDFELDKGDMEKIGILHVGQEGAISYYQFDAPLRMHTFTEAHIMNWHNP
jgi:hypothetical protein